MSDLLANCKIKNGKIFQYFYFLNFNSVYVQSDAIKVQNGLP